MKTDNFCFYLQNRLIQTSQAGGQWYSDTSLFSSPWPEYWTIISLLFLFSLMNDFRFILVENLIPSRETVFLRNSNLKMKLNRKILILQFLSVCVLNELFALVVLFEICRLRLVYTVAKLTLSYCFLNNKIYFAFIKKN